MSAMEPDDLGEGDDDLQAAEYVLGVHAGAQQAVLARRAETDPAFARRVAAWEERLAPMADGVAPVAPPAAVKTALDRRLFGPAPSPARPGLWSSLALWRALAGGAAAALLLSLALPRTAPPTAAPSVMGSLAATTSDVHYMVAYDPRSGAISLAHLSGQPSPDHVFQLWLVAEDGTPVSLGVIPAGAAPRIPLADPAGTLLTPQAQVAISLEPTGGSPTGRPTGPVVAAGELRDI